MQAWLGLLVTLVMLLTAAPAAAALYRWIAADGSVHYTADLESIPAERRATAREIGHPGPQSAPPAAALPTGVVLPFSSGAPVVVEAWLNGVPLRLLLDTGADRTVVSPSALARAGVDTAAGRPVQITGVTGAATATLVVVPRLDVAGARIGPLAVVAHAVPSERIDGLLGRDVLDAFVVTFDAAGSRVVLTPR